MINETDLTYQFNIDEVVELINLLRKNDAYYNKLSRFYKSLESYVYSVMTIEEAKQALQ